MLCALLISEKHGVKINKVGQKSKPSACISLQVHKEQQKKLSRKMHRLKATTAKKIIFKQQGWSKLRC